MSELKTKREVFKQDYFISQATLCWDLKFYEIEKSQNHPVGGVL
jgi:hypothetical protein